jgi:precorrin-6B methylase 2
MTHALRWWHPLHLPMVLFWLCCGFLLPAQASELPRSIPQTIDRAEISVYQSRPPSSDGIGKVYMGREIAQVMGHLGAGWLERPSRSTSEHPQRFIEALSLQPTDSVADIGAGTGYISFRLAPLLPDGEVFAIDVQPEMLNIVERARQRRHMTNVKTILGTQQNPGLKAESIDLALMVDAYHEFAYPREMMAAIVQALKPNGRVVLVEYKAENPLIFIKRHHKMSVRQVRKEMLAIGLTWQGNVKVLPQQHVLVFRKEATAK